MLTKLEFTKKDLLELPYAKKTEHNSILVCANGKHSSGYASMLIVGLENYDSLKNAKIVSKHCDSIQWKNNNSLHFASEMYFQSGIIHFFSIDAYFKTIGSGSTVFIDLIKHDDTPF